MPRVKPSPSHLAPWPPVENNPLVCKWKQVSSWFATPFQLNQPIAPERIYILHELLLEVNFCSRPLEAFRLFFPWQIILSTHKKETNVLHHVGRVIFLSIVVMKNNYIPLMNSPVYRDGTHPLATQTDSTSRAATVARLLHLELWFLEKNRDNLQINRSSPSHPNLSNHEYLT